MAFPNFPKEMGMYVDATLRQYVDDLAAKLPTPGGGSAAALSATLGISLISMVINFTLGKPRYEKYQKELAVTLEKAEQLRKEFLSLVDLDVQAYKSKNLRDALDVPFMLCRLCYEGMKLCPPLIRKGNRNLVSDVAVAAVLLESAFASAYYNVEINLKSLANDRLSRLMRRELLRKGKAVRKIRATMEEKVGAIIRR